MAGERAAPPIRFGTGGWRGVLGEDFSFARARALAAAVGAWAARERPGAPVLVAHDTRFLADRAADEAASALAGEGAAVVRAAGAVPTPVLCRAVVRRGAAAGLIVTASHNPPEYLGVKLVGRSGCSPPAETLRALEEDAAARLAAPPAPGGGAPVGRVADFVAPYLGELARVLDAGAFRRRRVRVVYDAFHGTGAGVLDRLLERLGVRVALRRGEPDPLFGGEAPDPSAARLGSLSRALRREGGLCLGLATDGDADRFAAVDAGGRILSEAESLALLVDHVATTRGLRGAIALSHVTGSLVARVAESHGLRVERHPIGFACLSEELAEGRAVLAGEESGGFAWAPFARDKDGILAGALLAERVAASGVPLGRALRELERAHGRSSCGRGALALSTELRAGLARLAAAPPQRFDGVRVAAVDLTEGPRLALADGGFVLWRVSGTEPVARIYAEAPTPAALRRRLDAARALLARAARRTRSAGGAGSAG